MRGMRGMNEDEGDESDRREVSTDKHEAAFKTNRKTKETTQTTADGENREKVTM